MKDEAYICGLVGGIGSGKSTYLAFEGIRWCVEESPLSAGIAASITHDTLDNSFLKEFKVQLENCGIEFVHGLHPPEDWNVPLRNKFKIWKSKLTTRTGHVFVTATLDNFDAIRGAQYGIALLDELAFTPTDEAFDVVLGRMRCKFARRPKVRFATSPNSQNWFWGKFVGPKRVPSYRYYHAPTTENTSHPESYFEILKTYNEEKYAREVLGLFNPIGTNRCYTEYDEDLHDTDWGYLEGVEVFVGCDFNRSPMAWIVAQIDTDDTIHVFDEIYIPTEATTLQAAEEVQGRYPKSHVICYPDISGSRRHTTSISGIENDADILEMSGFEVVFPGKQNPPQAERIESVQERLRAKTLRISKERCPQLVSSLITTMYKPGSRQILKSKRPGSEFAGEHPSDALGYLVHGYDQGCGIEPFVFKY